MENKLPQCSLSMYQYVWQLAGSLCVVYCDVCTHDVSGVAGSRKQTDEKVLLAPDNNIHRTQMNVKDLFND